MELNYETINDRLYAAHRNLSGYWTSIGINNLYATVYYDLEDGTEEKVLISKSGSIIVSDKLIREMDSID